MSNRGGPFPNLDAYRGIGMVMVMTNHAAYSAGLFNRQPTLNAFIARFDISIPVFFMVSGFLLFRPYVIALLEDRPRPDTRSYLANRAFRILPAYWVALAGVLLWYGLPALAGAGWFDHRPAGPVAFYGLMLQTFNASTVFKGFGAFDQAWSIGTEVTFYLLLPVLAAALHRRLSGRGQAAQVRSVLALCAGLVLVAQLWRVGLVAAQPGWIASATFWLPAHIDFFALGMAMATISASEQVGRPLPRPVAWLAAHPGVSWLAALALWTVVVNPTGAIGLFDIRRNPLDFTGEYVAKQLMYVPVGFFYLLPAMFGPQRVGRIRTFLGSRAMSALGAVSLGFYLWHKAWLLQAQEWTGAQPFAGSFPKLWLITFAGGLASGVGSFWLVERPFLAMKSRRAARRRATVRAMEPAR